MEFLEKWFTKRNTMYVSIVAGALMLVTLLLSFTVDMSSRNAGFTVTLFCIMYYVYYLIYIVLCGAYGFLYFKKQNKEKMIFIGFIFSLVMILVCFLNWRIIRALWSLANGSLYGVMDLIGIADSLELRLNLLRIMMFASVAYAGYQIYLCKGNKEIELTPEQQQAINEGLEKAKKSAVKGASVANEQLTSISHKLKIFLQTKKGKSIVGAILAGIVCIGIFYFVNANKKTSINLTASCEYKISGQSGEGRISSIDCKNDYTGDDERIKLFLATRYYEVTNNGTLKNGDTAIIHANYEEADLDKLKISISHSTFEVEVKDLIEKYKEASELPSDILTIAMTKAKEAVIKEGKNAYYPYGSTFYRSENITAEEPQIVKAYMLEGSYSSELVLLYKAKVNGTSKEGDAISADMYYKATLTNPSSEWLKNQDGIRCSTSTLFKDYAEEFSSDEEAIKELKSSVYSGTLVEIDTTSDAAFSKDAA